MFSKFIFFVCKHFYTPHATRTECCYAIACRLSPSYGRSKHIHLLFSLVCWELESFFYINNNFGPESPWKPLFFLNHMYIMQAVAILSCFSSSGCFLAFVTMIVKSVISPFFGSFSLFFASTMGASALTCLSQHTGECSRVTSSGYYCVFNPVWAF